MNLIERAKSILLQPPTTWATIDAEPTDAATLYTRYAMVLAAATAILMALAGILSPAPSIVSRNRSRSSARSIAS